MAIYKHTEVFTVAAKDMAGVSMSLRVRQVVGDGQSM